MSLKGLALLLAASALFSVMAVLVKTAGAQLPSSMLVLARAVVTLILSLIWLRAAGLAPLGVARQLLVLRGVFGFIGLLSFFFAVTRLPLTEVTVLFYLNPVFTALLAALVLKEPITKALVAGLALSLTGVVVVTRPAFLFGDGLQTGLDPLGVAAALVGAVGSAAAYVTVRKLRETDDPLVTVFYFALVAVPLSLPFALPSWVWPTGTQWLLLLGIGLFTQAAQVCLTRGITLVPAGRATSVGYVQVVFATLWGLLLFGEVPTTATWVGALLVVLGVLTVTFGHQPARA